jgi:hypothetical protein
LRGSGRGQRMQSAESLEETVDCFDINNELF